MSLLFVQRRVRVRLDCSSIVGQPWKIGFFLFVSPVTCQSVTRCPRGERCRDSKKTLVHGDNTPETGRQVIGPLA